MDYLEQYDLWLNTLKQSDIKSYKEILAMDETQKMEAFSLPLEFGTAGLRGIMGVGPSRMNTYTIERTTQGFADTINNSDKDNSIAIAYDTRYNSELFAKTAALVLAANGIKVHLFTNPMPTPFLSYTIRKLKVSFGIVITASHNPKEYNGYKAYDHRGVQVSSDLANEITENINKVQMFTAKKLDESCIGTSELIVLHYEDIINSYISDLKKQLPNLKLTDKKGDELRIVYSALHGTGAVPVSAVLAMQGFNNAAFVQMNPDPAFGGLKMPNPEAAEAYEVALIKAKEMDADLIFATDPDADRIGVQVKTENGYVALTSNQMASLVVDYLINIKKENGEKVGDNYCVLSTIVSGQQALEIARSNGIYTKELLTGFKYIGDVAEALKIQGINFLFGYEESYGLLTGDMVRDKDAVSSAALICEMALYYKLKGTNVYARLNELNEKYGYYIESVYSQNIKPLGFAQTIKDIMSKLRNEVKEIGSFKIKTIEDYLYQKKLETISGETVMDELPVSDVLKLYFEDGTWLAVRPSGTEPKIKFYYAVKANTKETAINKAQAFKIELSKLIETL